MYGLVSHVSAFGLVFKLSYIYYVMVMFFYKQYNIYFCNIPC